MSGFSGRSGGRDSGGRNSGGRDGGGRGGRDSGGGGRGGGRDSGGRDGGRGRGGPSGGRDGGGLTGRNKHMGEVPSVQALTQAAGMTDRDILAVINPPAADRDRSNRLDASYSLESAYKEFSKMLPAHADWRQSPKIGKRLNPQTQIVRSNHFRIDTRSLPTAISQYVIHLYKFDHQGKEITVDCVGDEDSRTVTELVIRLGKNNPQWLLGSGRGFCFNGRSIVFTSTPLPLPVDENKGYSHSEIIFIMRVDGSLSKSKYRIVITLVETIIIPNGSPEVWSKICDERILMALDSPLLSFARLGVAEACPKWFVLGSKAFKADGQRTSLTPAYDAQRGYYAGLKLCMAGLVLVCDMSVQCFLVGGPMIDFMWRSGGYRSLDQMLMDAKGKGGIPQMVLERISTAIKGAKVRLTHLGHFRKAKSLGPPCNSKESTFSVDSVPMTVAEYFAKLAKVNGSLYKAALPTGALKYPQVPCINLGSQAKPIYVPAELLDIPGGQCRARVCTPEMTAKIITESAVRPDVRMNLIIDGDRGDPDGSIINVMRNDSTMKMFGLNAISKEPIAVSAIVLPQAKLRYGGGAIVDPMLSGTWNMDGKKFSNPPVNSQNIGYGMLIVGGRGPPTDQILVPVGEFKKLLESDAASCGLKLISLGNHLACSSRLESISENLTRMLSARFVVVILLEDCYGSVKLAADKMGLTTQCVKMKKLERLPKGYCQNLMLKINSKLGGTNHTLVSRLASGKMPASSGPVFQDPPASLSWIFDKPTMLVGIDVSHGETMASTESVAAVVASMDGRAGQYAAHISVQGARVEIVSDLENAMTSLLTTFRQKNNSKMPSSIIVYRDGVGEGQFSQVTTTELTAIRGAVELMGYTTDNVKIMIVVCQKGHHTRFVYEDQIDGSKAFINPCPGLCIDASGGVDSIASGKLNQFYLNSHAAIQGTAKPCKYTLVHDEIGIKISELEILTYWLTYMYCRANKSVSYASPAYYAHWASKRGKYLTAAGATSTDLLSISNTWGDSTKRPTMFFV